MKNKANVVFGLDASFSMEPLFDGVQAHIGAFAAGIKSNLQINWDVRYDFVAYKAAKTAYGNAFTHSSIHHQELWHALYKKETNSKFFTSDAKELQSALADVVCEGDEATFVALDYCLDFPWRDDCHRVVILMTDELLEDGVWVKEQQRLLPKLIEKIQDLNVMLFLVAPDSPAYHELSTVDKCEYEIVDASGTGLATVDFKQVLAQIGKSVSVSMLQSTKTKKVERGIFGQQSWGTQGGEFVGR